MGHFFVVRNQYFIKIVLNKRTRQRKINVFSEKLFS